MELLVNTKVYEDEVGWVGYGILENGTKIISAHTDTKYSIGMLRALKDTFNKLDKDVLTVLPHQYLVEFYQRHCKVELLHKENKVYRLSQEA